MTNLNQPFSGSSNFGNSKTKTITSLTGSYSLAQEVTFHLDANSSLNFTTTDTLAPAVPEPATITLLGATTLGLLAFMAPRRNKVAGRS